MATRRSSNHVLRPVVFGALAACALAAVGCGGANSYRFNLTPDVMTLSERDSEVANKLAIMVDTNLRLINEDMARLTLVDRPSRLHKRPKPY